jgi:hypothetical protein
MFSNFIKSVLFPFMPFFKRLAVYAPPDIPQCAMFCRHTGAVIFDYIGINRWNKDYKRKAVCAAARAMAEGRKAGKALGA